jgi:hypothetical protein
MKKEPLGKELGTAIILATEDFFRKKFKSSAGEERKYLNWEDLLRNSNVNRLMMTRKAAIGAQGQKAAFLMFVR